MTENESSTLHKHQILYTSAKQEGKQTLKFYLLPAETRLVVSFTVCFIQL
jgi:hypothetical protein